MTETWAMLAVKYNLPYKQQQTNIIKSQKKNKNKQSATKNQDHWQKKKRNENEEMILRVEL